MQCDFKSIYKNVTRKNMAIARKTGKITCVNRTDSIFADYADYIFLPYVNEQDIYTAFLREKGIDLKDIVRFSSVDIGTNFRCYIQKQEDGECLMKEYFEFKKKQIIPVIRDWCLDNGISCK